MKETNLVLSRILVETILKSRILKSSDDLESLIGKTVPKLSRALHCQDRLLTEKQVAQRYGDFLTLTRLRNYRSRGKGPHFVKMGTHRNSRVFYRVADIEQWIAAHYHKQILLNQPLST